MNVLYNTQPDIATNLASFFKSACPSVSKTTLNILPYIIVGMIDAESVVSSDIARKLKGNFQLVQLESIERRFRRFFSNPHFDIYSFYHSLISYVISHFSFKHRNNVNVNIGM